MSKTKLTIVIFTILAVVFIATQPKPDPPNTALASEISQEKQDLQNQLDSLILSDLETRLSKQLGLLETQRAEEKPEIDTTSKVEAKLEQVTGQAKSCFDINKKTTIYPDKFQLPINSCFTSLFGSRSLGGKTNNHKGIDFRCRNTDMKIKSASNGKVIAIAETFTNNGGAKYAGKDNYISILSQSTVVTYRHLAPNGVKVKVGQLVKTGDHIGTCGTTGWSTAVHLHIEFISQTELESGKKYSQLNFDNPNQFYKIINQK